MCSGPKAYVQLVVENSQLSNSEPSDNCGENQYNVDISRSKGLY